MKTTHLVVILGAILWPAARYDVSAADYAPQVSLTGEGAGGQIYYQNGFPGVQLVRIPNLEEDVAAEAQTSSPVVREAAALNGFYRMSVDLPAGIVAVSAVAPTYAYAEAYLYNNWYWANMDGSAQAHVNDRLDQVTVFGPFDAGAMVPCVIRARVRGTLQAGPTGQGWGGRLARFSPYDVQAKASCRIAANTGFDYRATAPSNGAPAGGSPESIEQVIESAYQVEATVAGQSPLVRCPDVSVSIAGQNGASGSLNLTFEIVLPRGYSYSSLLGTRMKVIYVNAQPSFTDTGGVIARADVGPQTVPNWANAITSGPPDEAAQALSFVVTGNSNPSLFAAGPAIASDGTLTFTPAGTVGSAQVTVVLKDDGGTTLGGVDTSTPHTITIEVMEGNQPPLANAGGPYRIDQGNPLVLDGQASSDADAALGDSIVTYEWDLNDDAAFGDATGPMPTVSASALEILGLGIGTHPIHLRVTDSHGATDTASTTLAIRCTQTINFDPITARVFGDASFTVNPTASSGLPVTLKSLTPGVATVSGNTVTLVGAGTATLRASQAGDANWQPSANVERTFTVAKATPVIHWERPADVNCTTPLGPIQLSATASVPGAFAYSPSIGTYLSLGDAQTLTANFTPADSANYESTSAATTIDVRVDAVSEVWVQRHAGTILSGPDEVVATRVDADGNVIVTGRVSTDRGGDFYTAKYAVGDGNLIWECFYNGPDNMDDQATALELDASGNVVVTGISWSITGHADFYTAKYAAADGAMIWERRYDGPTPAEDAPTTVAVDRHGDVVVAGESNYDFYTAKYDGTNGALLWEHRYNGLGNLVNGSDKATALTVDAERNVVVTGYSLGTKSRPDFYTAKYAGSDGALLWERRYQGPGRFWDMPAAVAVDAIGNVVVTGSSTGDGTETDYYTAKYAAADGAIIWEQRYNGPVPPPEDLGSDDMATALAIDVLGNVVVTGHSTDALGNWEFCTMKYAAANGALIWEHRHHGPSPGLSTDEPIALLLDAHGNVVVAGSSTGPNWNQDFFLAKYAAADGALIWDKRFNAVYNQTAAARARSVALAPDNDVIVAGAVSMGLDFNDMLTVRFRPIAEPSITVNGPTSMSLALHSGFTELGATATDACGSPLAVTVTGSVDTSAAGTYALTYFASDDVGQRVTATRFVTVLQGSQTLNFAPLANRTYGDAWFDINATASSGLPVTFISLTPSVVMVSGNRVTIVGAGTAIIRASQTGDANWQSAPDVDQPLTVVKAAPVVGWATPGPITSSTPLSGVQLNATADVPGIFDYQPVAGTTLPRGTHLLSVDFTPADAMNYAAASAAVSLEVLNSGPIATAQSVTTVEDTAVAITLAGTDADTDTLTFTVVDTPAHGTLFGTAPNLTFTPAPNYHGADQFTFVVSDGTITSPAAVVSITVKDWSFTSISLPSTETAMDPVERFANPYGGLTEIAGTLYGTASGGGSTFNPGSVFRVNLVDGSIETVHAFTGADGLDPFSALTASGGMLYGTTANGTLFRINPLIGEHQVLHHFLTDAFNPQAGVVEVGGSLFGTTVFNSAFGGTGGTVYRYDLTTDEFAVAHVFTGADGSLPYAGLVESHGQLYGTAYRGGVYDKGTLYRFDPVTEGFQVLHQFNGAQGAYPSDANLLVWNNKLYGTTWEGGAGHVGVVYSFDLADNRFTVLHEFSAANGSYPNPTLLPLSGLLYGTTYGGGDYGLGTVFRLDPSTGVVTVLHHFQGSDGSEPSGRLARMGSAIYGSTWSGGADGIGTVFRVELQNDAPVLTALNPAAAHVGGAGFNLTISGGCFLPGAMVHWNGSPRPTTMDSVSQVTAVIPSSDLQTGGDVAVAAVQVVNGDGRVSNSLGFGIVPSAAGAADAAVAEPGTDISVSTAPTTAGKPGVSVTVQNGGTERVSVLAATYDQKPVGETAFRVDNGAFVDVQIAGANPNVAATVWFYYPSDVTGPHENHVKLRYFNGSDWIAVRTSGGAAPIKDTSDNLDGTFSGGRFEVIFDATSTPTIVQLGGTVFGMFESAPQIGAVTGPPGPVALGGVVSVTAQFAVVGDPADATVRFVWDDGTATVTDLETATSATATHLYGAPGVYTVVIEVSDADGDASEGRYEYAVIYDPNGGFVTGGGWIESPAGAFLNDPGLAGRATFGLNSRYLKGRTVPIGQTQFQFQAGDFGFQSIAYEWLVVSGAKAQYKGVGQVNGTGDFGFLLSVTDGQLTGGGGTDKFRIKVWDLASGVVVYDNRRGIPTDLDVAEPQALGGGSIVIHKAK